METVSIYIVMSRYGGIKKTLSNRQAAEKECLRLRKEYIRKNPQFQNRESQSVREVFIEEHEVYHE